MENSREIKLVQHPLKLRKLEVKKIETLAARMVRITFTGGDLEGFVTASPDDHVKLFFPKAGESDIQLQELSEILKPENTRKPPMRDYTPRAYRPDLRELDIDFFLHEGGFGSAWAKSARVGFKIGVGGPRGSKIVPYAFDAYVMIGDESFLPSIGRRLEEIPNGKPIVAVIEVDDAADEIPLKTNRDVKVVWVHRKKTPHGSQKLKEALEAVNFPEGDFYTWIAGEASVVRELREYMLSRGAKSEWMKASGYWSANGESH